MAVEVSLGGAGMRRWGDGGAAAPAAFGMCAAEMEGAGVRGGGGEEVVGVTVGAGESRSMGLGVRRGGVGVVGVEVSGVVPLVDSPCSDWLPRTSSLSIIQHSLKIGFVLQLIPGAVPPKVPACL